MAGAVLRFYATCQGQDCCAGLAVGRRTSPCGAQLPVARWTNRH
ncbi:MAG: hypothetical protein R2838_06345 [Caldilineaceae bacterium]